MFDVKNEIHCEDPLALGGPVMFERIGTDEDGGANKPTFWSRLMSMLSGLAPRRLIGEA